jgi:SPP1 family predicted phage head-tail adaptor
MSRDTIGALRHRVTFENLALTSDAIGGKVHIWTPVATVWARYEPQRAREIFSEHYLENEETALFTIRYRTDITPKMRVIFEGKQYDIQSIIHVLGERRWSEVTARYKNILQN